MKKQTDEDVVADLELRFKEARKRVVEGWVPRRDFVSTDRRRKAVEHIRLQRERLRAAICDRDPILFQIALKKWEGGFGTVNKICGEGYRRNFPDPELWPLRYFRWMNVMFMKLECDLGILYILPRTPERVPRVEHWVTAEEMISILNTPGTVAAIKTFGLPARPGRDRPPPDGMRDVVYDFVNPETPTCYYNFKEGVARV